MNDEFIRDLLGLPKKTKLEELHMKRIQLEIAGFYREAMRVCTEIMRYILTEEGKRDWIEYSKGFRFFKENGVEIKFYDDLELVKE